jgi:hypothetical protein
MFLGRHQSVKLVDLHFGLLDSSDLIRILGVYRCVCGQPLTACPPQPCPIDTEKLPVLDS